MEGWLGAARAPEGALGKSSGRTQTVGFSDYDKVPGGTLGHMEAVCA